MSQPAERTWIVEHYRVNERGELVEDPSALTNALLELYGLLHRVGGVVQIATRRRELYEGGPIITAATVYRWRSFVPVDHAQEAPAPERDGTAEQAAAPPPAAPAEVAEVVDENIPDPAPEPASA